MGNMVQIDLDAEVSVVQDLVAASLARGLPEHALSLVAAALRRGPNEVGLWTSLGVVYCALGQWEKAADALMKALHFKPDAPCPLTQLGMVRLTQGRFQEGWAAYRARWLCSRWGETLRYPAPSLWDGVARPGLRLLLWCESGDSNAIQFSRFAPWLQEQGMCVMLEAPEPLSRLLKQCWPQLAHSEPGWRFDAHLPLMDLPAVWRGALLAVPQGIPYIKAPALKVSTQCGSLRVGIAWGGVADYLANPMCSIDPALLAPLLAVPNIAWVGLQKDDECWPAGVTPGLIHTDDLLNAAELIAGLDLVIIVDSPMAHLAGALGKPVWLMLPYAPDWRWMLERADSPWYPTMRLFRQPHLRDWSTVLARVTDALKAARTTPVANYRIRRW